MRRVRFQDEAEKRNVSIEAITTVYEKLLNEGKLLGVIDAKNGELICYSSEEIEELVRLLESRRVLFKELAKKLHLKMEQARLVVEKLLQEGKIRGTLTQDGAFTSDVVLKNLVIKLSEKTRNIDLLGISNELSVPRDKVKLVIEELSQMIIKAIAPYKRIKIADISQETKLPENFIIALLKPLISQGKVSGSLDLVDGTLVRKLPQVSSKITSEEVKKTRPSGLWYLVPFFFSIIGGIVAYVGVKDDDADMAVNLLLFGIVMFFIDLLIVWLFYAWLLSLFRL